MWLARGDVLVRMSVATTARKIKDEKPTNEQRRRYRTSGGTLVRGGLLAEGTSPPYPQDTGMETELQRYRVIKSSRILIRF